MVNTLTIDERRTKAQDFLWIVQTGVLVLAAKVRRSDYSRSSEKVAEYSETGVFICADEAVRAAGMIPSEMTAQEAASAFCGFYAAPRSSSRPEVPHWFARHGVERHDYTIVNKADQFLWTVQTAVLADAENQASADAEAKTPDRFNSGTSIEAVMNAVRVASLIPRDVEATDAASEFLAFYSAGMKERSAPPKWCVDGQSGNGRR